VDVLFAVWIGARYLAVTAALPRSYDSVYLLCILFSGFILEGDIWDETYIHNKNYVSF
jgi:hypothetical protein